MPRRRAARRTEPRAVPLNPDRTLFETGTRDLWQTQVLTADGQRVGRIIRQVVEPGTYMVRYLVLYLPAGGRHLLLPSSTVLDINEDGVHCSLTRAGVEGLPPFVRRLDRDYEEALYKAAGCTPHWVEEAALAGGEGEGPPEGP